MEAQSSHPTAYELDCYDVQALGPDRRQEIARHLESCEKCRAYLAGLDRERNTLHQSLPARPFAREVARRAGMRPARGDGVLPAWGIALAGIAALVLVVVVSLRTGMEGTTGDGVRTMGMSGVQVEVFVKQGERVRPVAGSARVSAGDAVRIRLVTPRPAFVAVFFMDEAGQVSWYLPASGSDAPVAIAAGETTLPASARFDASANDERAFVVRSAEPFVPEEVARRVRDAWKRAGASDFATTDWLEGFDEIESVLFEKP